MFKLSYSPQSIICLLLFITSFLVVSASWGDQDILFQNCVSNCFVEKCQQRISPIPFTLRFFLWSCEDNCKYVCMHQITDKAILESREILQYYGKWPFHRFLGIQEPASVIFSILNGYIHYRYLPKLYYIQDFYYMKKFYIVSAYVAMNSWFWSTIYHTRDFPITEELDYFSAGLTILYTLFYTVLRVFQIRNKQQTILWALLCISGFLAHCSYLHFIKFDYGYNMTASIIIGMSNNLIWVGWSLNHWHKRPDDAWKPIALVLLILSAMSLEIFDFSPLWGILDAHSLWHASTIFIASFWYEFIIEDAKIESFRESKGKKIDKN